jgi:hypothetical protein
MEQREPPGRGVRPTGMPRRSLPATAPVLLVLAVLAGCGAGEGPSTPDPAKASGQPSVHRCGVRGQPVEGADLDGDGHAEEVRLTTGGTCGDSVVAILDGQVSRAEVPGGLAPARATVVHGPGDGRDLLLVRATTSRPGVLQPRLYGAGPDGVTEVTAHGEAWLPELDATRGAAPREASCAPGGRVRVLTARASRPPGIVLAWDLTRTTYQVRGTDAVVTGRRQVGRSLADPVLRRERPGLYDGRILTRCT